MCLSVDLFRRESTEALDHARLHTRCRVLLDGAVFCSLVDSLVEARECLFGVFYALAGDQLTHCFYLVFHRLLAARIKDVSALRYSLGFFC